MNEILKALEQAANPDYVPHYQRFFKTGPGQYGEGDIFIGIRNPDVRAIARQFRHTDPVDLRGLLAHPWHEARLTALVIMIHQFARGKSPVSSDIYDLYMAGRAGINNWDLVDISAPHIPGVWLLERDRQILDSFVRSENLWERRIAVISTMHFIKKDDFSDTLRYCEQLLDDRHDLMHKACGWMLREIGKREVEVLREFLSLHAQRMPRTMLRYAIEKLPESERQDWLRG